MTVAGDPASMAKRVETLLHDIAAAPTVQRARANSEELARTLVEMYGGVIERILTIVDDHGAERGAPIFAALCEDRFVESVLVLHDLHPLSLADRVRAALDSVRPYLASHAGGIEVVAVADGVAHVRLEGTCDGCPSSAATVTLAVERAILDRIHEVTEVRVVNVVPVSEAPQADRATTLQIQTDWIALDALPALTNDGLTLLEIASTPIVLVAAGGDMYAYRNRCPACLQAFAEPRFVHPFLRCSACTTGYDVARGGRADADATLHAEPFPLVRDGARVRVAIPLGV